MVCSVNKLILADSTQIVHNDFSSSKDNWRWVSLEQLKASDRSKNSGNYQPFC